MATEQVSQSVTETTEQLGSGSTTQTSTLAPGQAVQDAFQALITAHDELVQGQRSLHKTLVSLSRQVNREMSRLTKSRTKRTVTQNPVSVTSKMTKFMNKQGVEGSTFTRRQMMKTVSSYIKSNNLQNTDDRKLWTADKTLAGLFKEHPLKSGDVFSFLRINGLLTSVIQTSS